MEAGKILKKIRLSAGLHQAALARRAGLKRSYISKVELGTITPKFHNVIAILKALDVESVYISLRSFEKVRIILRNSNDKFEFTFIPEKE